MLICIPDLLGKDDVADFHRLMGNAKWEDGRLTAGSQSACVRDNTQLPPDSQLSRNLGERVLTALDRHGVDDPGIVRLTGLHHNLIRHWARL